MIAALFAAALVSAACDLEKPSGAPDCTRAPGDAPQINALQTVGTVLLPFASAYKDVFAFAVVIAIMAWRPTGLIQEKISERV